jgi:hypothetical protein
MKNLLIILLSILACSCTENYTYYIETESGERIVAANSTIGENEVGKFYAPSDSAAYIEGYTRLVLAQKLYNDLLRDNLNEHGKPVKLVLINEDGTDISDIQFVTRSKEEQKIRKEYFISSDN